MSDILNRAKLLQMEAAKSTSVVLKLELLEGLIHEIELLQHRVDALSQDHRNRHPVRAISEVKAAAEGRKDAGGG